MGAVVTIGGKESWVLAAVEGCQLQTTSPTKLLWVSLAQRKVAGRQLLPPAETVLDYYPPAHRLLTYATVKAKGEPPFAETAVLTLWEVLPTDKQVKPVVRWDAHINDVVNRIPGLASSTGTLWFSSQR